MIGLDTNVLVRFLVRDDEDQHRRAVGLLRQVGFDSDNCGGSNDSRIVFAESTN